ncbi:hypothetical protein [Streptomyces sp. NPDC097619]|uniref:hypothetical protein n=1 Tax=Streptomyces sp. NPDC097619 TaxID=3157228 RepID=UPI003323CCF9
MHAAEEELAHARAVEADLLSGAGSGDATTSAAAADLAIRRARALARSGQMARAEAVARAALEQTADPARTARLHRVLIFTRTVRGDAPGALALVDATLAGPLPEHLAAALTEHRTQLVQLAGLEPDIARSLYVSTRTVQAHVSRTPAKLGLGTLIELAAAHANRPDGAARARVSPRGTGRSGRARRSPRCPGG